MINLKTAYGKKYRVEFNKDEYSKDIQITPPEERNSFTDKAWYYKILCKYGEIEIADESDGLMFYCTSANVARRMERDIGDRIDQYEPADGEAIIYFREQHLKEIMKYAKPRRRRKLSEEHKQKLISAGAKYQFTTPEPIQMTLAV